MTSAGPLRTPDGLAEIGRTLHGHDWQAPLARDLGVNRESVRRWLNGAQPLPPEHGIWDDLVRLAVEAARDASDRAQMLDDYAQRIRRDAP